MADAPHDPVLLDEVVTALAVPGDDPAIIIDCTAGAGGHSLALLRASGRNTHLVGFDRDRDALEIADRRLEEFGDRVTLIHDTFDHIAEHVAPMVAKHGPVMSVLYDLGVSSMQIDTPGRGFSFRAFGPLDMRMDPDSPMTAAELVNAASETELVRILREYGEESHAARIAAGIVEARPFTTTVALADLIAQAMPRGQRRKDRSKGIHPATRSFQALRIAVNGELERFSASLPQALDLVAAPPGAPTAAPAPTGASPDPVGDGLRIVVDGVEPRGGRIATIAYHSLEDRIAKRFFSDAADGCICPPDLPVCGCGRVPSLARRPRRAIRPTPEEVERNPRSRSAVMRVAERLGDGETDPHVGQHGTDRPPRTTR